jgi:hydrolase, NUDIX family
MDYIQNIRKKVGKDKIILNFTCGILNQSGKILLQKRADKGTWGLPGGDYVIIMTGANYLDLSRG